MQDFTDQPLSLRQFEHHPRHWRANAYVYPVISRRSGGLSIGINLNPDMACNFDCIYCQVDRTVAPKVRRVELPRLEAELESMVALAQRGELFEDEAFVDVPLPMRTVRDLAFSGDGEPTTCPQFCEAVALAADLRQRMGLHSAKLILITDACFLTRPGVQAGLAIMDRSNGEVWAKLDAGTEEYYRLVNRPSHTLEHVMENIISAACVRPVVIQSMFMRVHSSGPVPEEITAFVGRLKEVLRAGGRISHVQVYTVARRPAQTFVSPLSKSEVDDIAARVRSETGLPADAYYGTE